MVLDSLIPYGFLDPDDFKPSGSDPDAASSPPKHVSACDYPRHIPSPPEQEECVSLRALQLKGADVMPEARFYPMGSKVFQQGAILPVGAIGDGYWYSDCIQYLPKRWNCAQGVGWLTGAMPYLDRDNLLLRLPKALKEEHLQGDWCVMNDIVGHRNLVHFFADVLPQLMAIRNLRAHYPGLKVLVRQTSLPNLKLIYSLLLPECQVIRLSGQNTVLRPNRLILQPLAFNGGVGFVPEFKANWWLALSAFQEGIAWLRTTLLERQIRSEFRGRWIYLSRNMEVLTQPPRGRNFTNHGALLEALTNRGVIVLDPACFAITALASLLSQARGFIGIHGAGLANTYLAAVNTPVIEIRPWKGSWRMVEFLGRCLHLDWHVSFSIEAGTDMSLIDIAGVCALIDTL